MINKKERTLELYKLVGAEMRLFRTLGGNLAIHMSQVLLSTDTDKFMRVLQKIDEVRSRAEDNMFHDHPEVSNDYLNVFYGDLKHEPRTPVDAEVKAPGKKPRVLQVKRHEKLRELGFRVFVLDALEDIPGLLQTIAEGGDAQ